MPVFSQHFVFIENVFKWAALLIAKIGVHIKNSLIQNICLIYVIVRPSSGHKIHVINDHIYPDNDK